MKNFITLAFVLFALTTATAQTEINYPDGSYEIEGTILKKWVGTESIIDMQADPKLRMIDAIADDAFRGLVSLTEITLSSGVTEIGRTALDSCLSLTKVTLPEGLTKMGKSVFTRCSSLKSITLPASLEDIDDDQFLACSSLYSINVDEANTKFSTLDGILFDKGKTKLICYPAGKTNKSYTSLPEELAVIGKNAFKDNIFLTEISLPEGMTGISSAAFFGCTSLKGLILPESVNEVASNAFGGCSSLEEVTFPKKLEVIGGFIFRDCISLKSILLPESLRKIGNNIFIGCTSLASIEISEDNTKFSSVDGVLYNKAVTDLLYYPAGKTDVAYTAPASLSEIKMLAFQNNKFLTKISLSKNTKKIANTAFQGASALTTIEVEEGNVSFLSENGILFNKEKTELIAYPSGKKDVSYVVSLGVVNIGNNAFKDCSALTKISFPESIREIKGYAFSGCVGLASVTCLAAKPPKTGYGTFTGIAENATLYVAEENVEAYQESKAWDKFSGKVKAIGSVEVSSAISSSFTKEDVAIWSSQGAIHIKTELTNTSVAIYNFAGDNLYRTTAVGELSVLLPAGSYLVVVNNIAYKLIHQ